MLGKCQGTKGDIALPSVQSGGCLPHPVDISSDALSAVIGGWGAGSYRRGPAVVSAWRGGQQQERLPDRVTSKLRPEAESR